MSILSFFLWGIFAFLSLSARATGFEELQVRLGVPPLQATVADAWPGSSDTLPDFIVIQDAHRNQEVQSRVAWIILHGYAHWGARKVFVEGAFKPIDLTVFHVLTDREQQDVSDHLIREGSLSGPERAGIQIMEREWRNPPISPFQVIGMEDPPLYVASLNAYKDVLSSRAQAQKQIHELRRLHDTLGLPQGHALRRQLRLISKMIDLRITPSEFELFQMNRQAMPASSALAPALSAAERFYSLADRRSVNFAEEVQRKMPAAPGPRMMVTGGFHTALLAQILRGQNHSYVVFKPNATEPTSDDLYERRLLETSCFF